MPLTNKGRTILTAMKKQYGSDEDAQRVFYASIQAGKIKGAEKSNGAAKKD